MAASRFVTCGAIAALLVNFARAQENSVAPGGSPVALAAPEGSVDVTLSADNAVPNDGQILEGTREIKLHFQSKSSKSLAVKVKWLATTVTRGKRHLDQGTRRRLCTRRVPRGDYRRQRRTAADQFQNHLSAAPG